MRVRRPEGGSALALVPAGFLVIILLGGIALDSAVTYLGQQQLHDALTAAANDAAGAAIDNASFYREGRLVLDPVSAATIVCQSVEAQRFSQLHDVQVFVSTQGPDINVTGSAVVDGVFGRAIPGFATRTVRASVDAVAEEAQGGARVEPRATPATVVSCSEP